MIPTKYCWFLASLAWPAPSWAQQWFDVSGPALSAENTLVEVDLDSVRIRAQGADGAIRVSFETPRAHGGGFNYRSFVANAQFDCQRRSISLSSAAYFQLPRGAGTRLGAESSGQESGMPRDLVESIPAAASQSLLRAACSVPAN